MPEVVTGISFGAILVSVGSSLGYVGSQYANGGSISGSEALVMFDQWVAGYAHGVSGGITTAIRREDYGEIQEGDHAFLWNMGNLAGISTSFILGFQVAAALAGQMGATKWGTTFARGWEWVTGGYGIYQAGMGLADGQWDYTDVFNLLSLVPYAVPAVTGVANSLGTMRAANRAAGGVADDVARAALSVDDMLRSSQKTKVKLELPTNTWDEYDVETTPLWRGVKDDELGDIQSHGIFRPSPYGSEGKYFSATPEGAASYSQQAYEAFSHEGPYTQVGTSIPNEFIERDMIVPGGVDGGIPTYVIPNEILPYLKPPIIYDSAPLPPRR